MVLEELFKQPKYGSILQTATERTWHLLESEIKKELDANLQTQNQVKEILDAETKKKKTDIHFQSDLIFNKVKANLQRRRGAIAQTAKQLSNYAPAGAAGLAPDLEAWITKFEDKVNVIEKQYETARNVSIGLHFEEHSHVHYHSLCKCSS